MSFDLAVWHSPRALTRKEAGKIYDALCEEDCADGVTKSSALAAFAKDLEKRIPEEAIEDWPPRPVGDSFLILNLSWSSAEKVAPVILRLAAKHGLICYDPQDEAVHHPPTLQSSAPTNEEPGTRDLFYECCREIGRALARSGFTYGQDIGPHVDRRRGPVDEIVGFTWNSTDDGAEFRMTLSIHSQDLFRWRKEQQKRDAQLSVGMGPTVASLDFRQLKPVHELFGWRLGTSADWNRVVPEACGVILTQGGRYSAIFESAMATADRFRQADVPGLRIGGALEYCLAMGGREPAASLLQGFLARRPDLQPPFEEALRCIRSGGTVAGNRPRDAWDMALAAHGYGLR